MGTTLLNGFFRTANSGVVPRNVRNYLPSPSSRRRSSSSSSSASNSMARVVIVTSNLDTEMISTMNDSQMSLDACINRSNPTLPSSPQESSARLKQW